jgi:hypothetical protein
VLRHHQTSLPWPARTYFGVSPSKPWR